MCSIMCAENNRLRYIRALLGPCWHKQRSPALQTDEVYSVFYILFSYEEKFISKCTKINASANVNPATRF